MLSIEISSQPQSLLMQKAGPFSLLGHNASMRVKAVTGRTFAPGAVLDRHDRRLQALLRRQQGLVSGFARRRAFGSLARKGLRQQHFPMSPDQATPSTKCSGSGRAQSSSRRSSSNSTARGLRGSPVLHIP